MDLKNRNQKQREFFNEKIASYDETHQVYMGTKKTLADNLDNSAKKILDLGAGTGLELIYVFDKIKDAEVTVIDITENMLDELLKRDFANQVKVICGDFFEVDFGSNYDAVISTSALHHFKKEEKEFLYKKIYECLKKDGKFINCDKISLTEEIEEHQLYELENNIDAYKHIDTPLTVNHEVAILESVNFTDITTANVDQDDYSLIIAKKGK